MASLPKPLRMLVGLPGPRLRMLLRALGLVVRVRAMLWAVPFGEARRRLDRTPAPPPLGPAEAAAYQRDVLWAVHAVARRLLGDKPCLVQSLAAQRLLREGGLDAELRIGVTKGERRNLLAHAWLEQRGRVILGGRESPVKYTPLASVHAPIA